MIARMTIDKADDVPMTLSITLPLSEWEDLAKQMPQAWPAWQFASLVRNAINSATKQIRVEEKEINS